MENAAFGGLGMHGIRRCLMTVATDVIRMDTLLQILPMIAVCLTVLAVTIACWAGQSAAEALGTQSRVYEVASIRPSAPSQSNAAETDIVGDRFIARNLSVQTMVYIAYGISSPDYISNLPKWTYSARFDTEAELDDDPAHTTELKRTPVILRTLLVDRFNLKGHYETRDCLAYALLVDKHGPKIREATATDRLEMDIRKDHLHLRDATMAPLIGGLSNTVGRPVIDKTGLTGRYNIDLKWTPDELEGTPDAGPSIFTALHEQLGLKLVPTKAPVDVLVVEQVERTSEN